MDETTTTGAHTPAELTSLKARALKAYATKDYALSADLYAQACQLQTELQGEANPANAQLLYLYGRALHKVAIGKSDVLGGGGGGGGSAREEGAAKAKGRDMAAISEEPESKADKIVQAKKASGLFQFHGDENFDDGDDDDDDDDDGGEGGGADGGHDEDEDEDEMSAAWQVLDLARVLFEKQLAESAAAGAGKPVESTEGAAGSAETAADSAEAAADSAETAADSTHTAESRDPASQTAAEPSSETAEPDRSTTALPALAVQQAQDVKTMLADVYDLLGEVSLESENFPQATQDFEASLALKTELYPVESTLISEAEFKMALALEFSAADEGVAPPDAAKLRDAAATHIDRSIASCRARIAVEQAKLDAAAAAPTAPADSEGGAEGTEGTGKGKDKGKGRATEATEASQEEIERVKEMMAELEQRAHDLRHPPDPVELEHESAEEMKGLLGQLLAGGGGSIGSGGTGTGAAALQAAMQSANDLSSLVRRRKEARPDAEGSAGSSSAKRKLELAPAETGGEPDGREKKAKVEAAADAAEGC